MEDLASNKVIFNSINAQFILPAANNLHTYNGGHPDIHTVVRPIFLVTNEKCYLPPINPAPHHRYWCMAIRRRSGSDWRESKTQHVSKEPAVPENNHKQGTSSLISHVLRNPAHALRICPFHAPMALQALLEYRRIINSASYKNAKDSRDGSSNLLLFFCCLTISSLIHSGCRLDFWRYTNFLGFLGIQWSL